MTRRQLLWSMSGALVWAKAAATAEPVAIDLVAAPTWVGLDGRFVELMAYNGQVPGPTLNIHPGQEVVIKLRNLLSQPTNAHSLSGLKAR